MRLFTLLFIYNDILIIFNDILKLIPYRIAIGIEAAFWNIQDDTLEIGSAEDILNPGLPDGVADDWRQGASETDAVQIRTVLHHLLHHMELGIREHQFPQIRLIGKRLLFDFIYLIGHSLEVHRFRYLDAGILGIGSPDRYDTTTPRLISQVSYLKLCHHIVSTRRLVHLIIY